MSLVPQIKEKSKTLPRGLIVPEKFFKIVIDDTVPRKAAAFIYSQNDDKEVKYSMREVPINQLDGDIFQILNKLGFNYTGAELSAQASLSIWKEDDCRVPPM